MTGRAAALVRRAGEWLVEPEERAEPALRAVPPLPAERSGPLLRLVPAVPMRAASAEAPPVYPLIAAVGLSRRCGATTLARALAAELAGRDGGAAVVGSAERPPAISMGSSAIAVRLADALPQLGHVRPAGRLCLAACATATELGRTTRHLAPAVVEVEPGAAALEAAPVVDQVVLVAGPDLEPALAAAVAESVAAVAVPPIVVVNRAPDHGPWLMSADVLVPDSRIGARLALSGREPRGWLGRSIEQLADLCTRAAGAADAAAGRDDTA